MSLILAVCRTWVKLAHRWVGSYIYATVPIPPSHPQDIILFENKLANVPYSGVKQAVQMPHSTAQKISLFIFCF